MRIKKTQVHGNKPDVADTPKAGVSDSKSKTTTQTAVKKTAGVKEAAGTKVTPKSPTRAAKNVESESAVSVQAEKSQTEANTDVASPKHEKSKTNVVKESKATAVSKTSDDKGSTASSVVDKNKKKIRSTALIKKSIGGNTNKKTTSSSSPSSSSSLLKRKINMMKKKAVGANKKSLSVQNPKKISNELKNLGIDILLDGPKGFGLKQQTEVEDCKTSICESVKTKSRSTVSASTNYVPFMKVNKIKSGQGKGNNDSSKATDENNESKKESDVVTIKEDSSSCSATTGKGDNTKKKSDSVNNKQEDDNNKKVKGNETPTVAVKEGAPKKNDEQIDSLIKKGTTNVKKVNVKKNNGKGKDTDGKTYDKLSNNEEKVTENDKDDDAKETDGKSVDAKEKLSKVKRKYVKKSIQKLTDKNDDDSKQDEKKDEKPIIEPPVSRPDSTTASIGSVSSKDIYEFSVTSPVRPLIRREPIFKHKAKLKAEAAQRQQLLQGPSSSPIRILSPAKTDTASISSEDKKEVELVVVSSEKKSTDSVESDEKKDEKDPLSIKSQEKTLEKDGKATVTNKKPTPQKKVNAKSKATPTASIIKDEDSDESDSDKDKKVKSIKKPVAKAKLIKRPTTIKKTKVIKKPLKLKSKSKAADSDESEDENDSESSESSVITRIQKRRAAKTRHMKKYGFWSGPKRHREASLNALAKVHCLYENESRSALEQNLIKAAKLESLKDMQKVRIEMQKKKKDEDQSGDTEEESKSSKNESSSDESEPEEPEEENKR